jgi:hypothetical protein
MMMRPMSSVQRPVVCYGATALLASKQANFISLLTRCLALAPDLTIAEIICLAYEKYAPGRELANASDSQLVYALREFVFERRPRECIYIEGGNS